MDKIQIYITKEELSELVSLYRDVNNSEELVLNDDDKQFYRKMKDLYNNWDRELASQQDFLLED